MTKCRRSLLPLLIALLVGACARQQPAYYVDSATGRPVAVAQQAPQPAEKRERGLFNNLALSRPAYAAPAYAQQAYAQQSYVRPQIYSPPAAYPPHQTPPMGGPYARPPQVNPYAQARWY